MIFVEIFHDFGRFFATRIRIRFIEADPADQNETDPQHWLSLEALVILVFSFSLSSVCQIATFPYKN